MVEKADTLFKGISSFPEIIGSFLFHNQAGVLKHHMPPVLKKADLDLLGKNLIEIFAFGQSMFDGVNEMVLAVADKNMIIKPMGGALFMIITCKTTALPHEFDINFSRPSEAAGIEHKTD